MLIEINFSNISYYKLCLFNLYNSNLELQNGKDSYSLYIIKNKNFLNMLLYFLMTDYKCQLHTLESMELLLLNGRLL